MTHTMFAFDAARYWRVRPPGDDDLPFPADDDGFLDAEVAAVGSLAMSRPGDLLSAEAAAEAHALVLLGEPGLGKTTAIRAIVGNIPGSVDRLTWIDGSDLDDNSFDRQLNAALAPLPQREAKSAWTFGGDAESAVVLVLDQLDESPMLRRLPRALRTLLADRDVSRLQLFIGCRTADLPVGLRELLAEAFDPCIFADLAPLKRADAAALATSCGVDGDALVSAAVSSAAGILAAVPLTLGLLVRTYQDTGGLGGGGRALFARGAEHLLAKPKPDRPASVTSTLDQRVAVAERIAAVLVLSGRRTLWRGRDLDGADVDLEPRIAIGGTERTSAGEFAVTKAIVDEVLATAMFSGRGHDRLAFVHSTYAAFLAARYLRAHALPRPQLEALFLVAGPDGSRTIPSPLRETAAWLATLDEVIGTWLAATDPEGLVGHDRVLEADDLRKAVIESLLARADEYELGARSWRPDPRLAHAEIAAQLIDVLNESESQPEWPASARWRLALRLASQARSPALAERLLQIAESEAFNSHQRSLAAEAALANDPRRAAPRLGALLARFVNAAYGQQWDGDDELKGNLLDQLWPEHVTLSEILPLLRPRQTENFLGTYWMFLRQFVLKLRAEDIPEVLLWAYDSASLTAPPGTDDDGQAFNHHHKPIGRLDKTILEALIERALDSDDITQIADVVAALLQLKVHRSGDYMAMPAALDEALLAGRSRETAKAKRLALAHALIRAVARSKKFNRADAWDVVYNWRIGNRLGLGNRPSPERRHLLDASDFQWACELAIHLDALGDAEVARSAAQVAEVLFNPNNREALEIAASQEGTVNWEFIGRWFEAIDLDSKQADELRERHERHEKRFTNNDDPEPQDPALSVDLGSWVERAAAGDTGIFWQLAWNLQFPPGAGTGPRRYDDRLLDFPGVATLGPDATAKLLSAARQYVPHRTRPRRRLDWHRPLRQASVGRIPGACAAACQ